MKLKHFKLDEFKCPCCGENKMDRQFLLILDEIRDYAGIPFIITSGYRCKKHNKEIGGKPNSAHLNGLAADIKCTISYNRAIIVNSIVHFVHKIGIPLRIGIAINFIHFDIDKEKPNPVIWVYKRR